MAHGTPDYGRTNAVRTTFQMMDLGELAVRLGSPISHDRRGDVIWWDDFECSGNKWNTIALGTGASVAVSTEAARNGANSMKVVGGSAGIPFATATHTLVQPVRGSLGVESSWAFMGEPESVSMFIEDLDGSGGHRYTVEFDAGTGLLLYIDAAGAKVPLQAGFNPQPTLRTFHTWKLVLDQLTHTYERIIVDGFAFPLPDIAADPFAIADPPSVGVGLTVTSRAGFNDLTYFDDVIFTQNEPT